MELSNQFTNEQLIAKAQEQIEFIRCTQVTGAGREHVDMCGELFEIALASLTAEPVAYMIGGHYLMHAQDPKVDNYASAVPLYRHAPPAPVVPDEVNLAIENLKQKLVECNRYNYCSDAVKRIEDSCRAVMLKGGAK